jgi:hypothetical protein
MPHSFGKGPSLNEVERQLKKSNPDEYNYGRQQMLNGQYIKMRINGVSTICGNVSTLNHQCLGLCYA